MIAALRARAPALAIHVRSNAPHWIFRERDAQLACSGAELELDVGMLQPNGLDLDLPATLAAHERFCARWNAHVDREAAFLREASARLVVSDIAPLAFAAAARAGLPAIGIANFSWDWILDAYAPAEPRWRPIVSRYAEAYASAALLLRLPLCGEFQAFPRIQDLPLLVNRSRRSREQCRRSIGLEPSDRRRAVLASFGGFGSAAVPGSAREEFEGYVFVSIGAPPAELGAAWISLPRPAPFPHEDLVHACDALLGKPGYGTAAEVLAHGTRFLYLPREDFREIPALLSALQPWGGSRELPRADFESGRWRGALDALFAQPAPRRWEPSDGAERAAEILLGALGSS